jgi:hypothetical protein
MLFKFTNEIKYLEKLTAGMIYAVNIQEGAIIYGG